MRAFYNEAYPSQEWVMRASKQTQARLKKLILKMSFLSSFQKGCNRALYFPNGFN